MEGRLRIVEALWMEDLAPLERDTSRTGFWIQLLGEMRD